MWQKLVACSSFLLLVFVACAEDEVDNAIAQRDAMVKKANAELIAKLREIAKASVGADKMALAEKALGQLRIAESAVQPKEVGGIPENQAAKPLQPNPFLAEPPKLSPPIEFRATADHGCVYLSFGLPDDLRNFVPVRVLIFRRENEDADFMSIGEIRIRSEEGETIQPAIERYVYQDFEVKPQKNYFYQASLVGRLVGDNQDWWNSDLTPVRPAKEGSTVKLFRSPATRQVEALTPSNYQIRFAGSLGLIPEGGQHSDYKGIFAVRAWIPDLRDWREASIQVPVGGQVRGVIRYRDKEGRSEEFDTGLRLVKIEKQTKENVVRTKAIKVKKNPDGSETVEYNQSGRPILEEVEVRRDCEWPVAVLFNSATKRNDPPMFQSEKFEPRPQALIELDKALLRQQSEK